MKFINRRKIVRTIIKYKGRDDKPDSYEIDFMTFEVFDHKSDYKFIDGNIELYPYKFYDLRWIYQIPAYWLLLSVFRKSDNNISRKMHKRTSALILIIELLPTINPIINLIKFLIDR